MPAKFVRGWLLCCSDGRWSAPCDLILSSQSIPRCIGWQNSNEMENKDCDFVHNSVRLMKIFTYFTFYIIFSSAFGNLTILGSSDSSGNCWEIDNLANAKYFNLKTHLTCRKKERKLKDACGRAETFLKRGGKSVLSKVVKCHLICQQHKIKVNKIQCWKSCQHSQNKSMANKMKIKHAFDCLSYQKIM